MKRIFLLLIACCFLSTISAQSTRKIRELEAKRKELHQQIAESETLLQSTKKDVKSQLDNLALLTGQIEERRKYISTIESDVHTLTSEIASLQKQLNKLQRDLKDKKRKYETSVQYMYRNKSVQEKLMFIFSAENLSQTYRRMRYVQEYANFQRLQGMEIERKQKQIAAKKREVEQTKHAKQNLLKQGEVEKAKLEIQEKERQTLLANLQKKQKGIQSEIRKKKRSAEQLNAQIDRLIEIEIEKASAAQTTVDRLIPPGLLRCKNRGNRSYIPEHARLTSTMWKRRPLTFFMWRSQATATRMPRTNPIPAQRACRPSPPRDRAEATP